MAKTKKQPKLGSGKRFASLSNKVAKNYEKQGISKEEAEQIGDATAAKIGRNKLGKKKMAKLAVVGKKKSKK